MPFVARTGLWALGATLLSAAFLAAAGIAQQEEAPPARGLTVRVVDMGKVLGASAQWRDSAQERLSLVENMRRTVNKLGQQVQALRNQCENLPPDTDERLQKEQEFAEALAELEQTNREFEVQLARQSNDAVRDVLVKIRAAVKAYAEENHVDLVLKRESADSADVTGLDQNLMLATTEVLYATSALDISDAIIELVNADYPGPIEVK